MYNKRSHTINRFGSPNSAKVTCFTGTKGVSAFLSLLCYDVQILPFSLPPFLKPVLFVGSRSLKSAFPGLIFFEVEDYFCFVVWHLQRQKRDCLQSLKLISKNSFTEHNYQKLEVLTCVARRRRISWLSHL